jgi:hypothetical protein
MKCTSVLTISKLSKSMNRPVSVLSTGSDWSVKFKVSTGICGKLWNVGNNYDLLYIQL